MKAPSPWNRDCRRQPSSTGTDLPNLALTPPDSLASPDATKKRKAVDEWAVGVVVLGFVCLVFVVGLVASAWAIWGPK